MNRHEEIEARLSAIAGEIDADGADIMRYIEEARAAHPELAAVGIEMIEESEQPALAWN